MKLVNYIKIKLVFVGIITLTSHKLAPYQYYFKIMKAIPYCEEVEDYEALLPWNIDPFKVATKNQLLTLCYNLNYHAYKRSPG